MLPFGQLRVSVLARNITAKDVLAGKFRKAVRLLGCMRVAKTHVFSAAVLGHIDSISVIRCSYSMDADAEASDRFAPRHKLDIRSIGAPCILTCRTKGKVRAEEAGKPCEDADESSASLGKVCVAPSTVNLSRSTVSPAWLV